VVCHNDVAPYNMVFVAGRLTGLVDWDTSAPGPRVWDLAHLAYRLVPLTGADDVVVPGDGTASRARRLRLLCDAYGAGPAPAEVLPAVVERLEALAGFTAARAGPADADLRRHVDLYRADARWVAEHAAQLGGGAADGPD
jgi:aminoglycoside phosphotransferase (APT) family kinase protein